MPAGFGDPEYLRVFDQIVMPVGREFAPEFVIVSCGFDCHHRDPLGAMRVSEAGFVAMTRRAKRLAAECCSQKLVLALEGGYDLPALAASSSAVLEELGRESDEPIAPAAGGEEADRLIGLVRKSMTPYWSSLSR